MDSKMKRNVTSFGLKDATIAAIRQCLTSHEKVEEAIIYGSRSKGNYRPSSDIDLTLRGDALIFSDLANLANDIDDLMLPYKFDISIYHHITNPDLLDHIARVGKPFYRKDVLF